MDFCSILHGLQIAEYSGGTIYVGVDDDGSIVGIKDDASKDKVDLKLGNWIQEAFFPKPSGLIQWYYVKKKDS